MPRSRAAVVFFSSGWTDRSQMGIRTGAYPWEQSVITGAAEKDAAKLKKSGVYALVILFFALGALLGGFTADRLGNYSILLCSAILLPVCILMIAFGRKKQPPKDPRPAEPGEAPGEDSRANVG